MLYRKSRSILILFFFFFFSSLSLTYGAVEWKKIKGNAIDVAVDDEGSAFVVSNKYRQVYRWDIYKQNWVALKKAPGDISKIAASQNNQLFAIVKGEVYKYQSKKWSKVGNFKALDLGVGPKGNLWAIDRTNKIAKWDTKRKKWLELKTSGTIANGKKPWAIDVDKNSNPIIVFRDNQVIHYNVSSKKWKKLSSIKLIDIACSSSGAFYGVGADGMIYKWNRSRQEWVDSKIEKLHSTVKRISLLPNDKPWVILNNGDIRYQTNKVMTEFLPSKHGFHFPNAFRFKTTIEFKNGIFDHFVPKDYYTYQIDEGYGLCGGMALGAHEYFVQKRKIPKDKKAPKKGDKLYDFVLDRLYVSFGQPRFSELTQALSWWGSIEYKETLLEEDTRKELERITNKIDQKEPVQLMLIYQTKTTGSPWDNHQVLAYGYEKDYSSIRFFIYDPNKPDRDDIVITLAQKTNGKHYLYQNGYEKPRKIYGMFPTFPKINR